MYLGIFIIRKERRDCYSDSSKFGKRFDSGTSEYFESHLALGNSSKTDSNRPLAQSGVCDSSRGVHYVRVGEPFIFCTATKLNQPD